MDQRSLRRWIDILLVVFSAVPSVLLIALYAFVIRARLELGRWPLPMSPDPKDLSFAPGHREFVFWFVLLTLACLLPWLLLTYFRLRLARDRRLLPFILAVPWVLVVVSWFADPGNYVDWFLD